MPFGSRRSLQADLRIHATATLDVDPAASTSSFRGRPLEQARDSAVDAILQSVNRLSTAFTDRIEQQETESARREAASTVAFNALLDRMDRLKQAQWSRVQSPIGQSPPPNSIAIKLSTTFIPP